MNLIPNNISCTFDDIFTRRAMIQEFGDSQGPFFGENQDGEAVILSISKEEGMVLKTFQDNGWLRVNTYNVDGNLQDETFEGRWRHRSDVTSENAKRAGGGLVYTVRMDNSSGMEFTSGEDFMRCVMSMMQFAQEHGDVHFEVDIEKEGQNE